MYILRSYLILFCLFLLSCREHLKIEANNDPQGYADSQVVGNWKVTALNSNSAYDWDGNGSSETDIYATWSSCQKDNLYVFVGNKTGTYRINCSLTQAGVWQIFDTKQLEYTPDGMSTEVERIISMSSNQFKTSRSVYVSSGQTFTVTKTWTRQ